MNIQRIEVRAFQSPYSPEVDLVIVAWDRETGRRSVATDITFHELADGLMVAPVARLPRDEAQALMDSLWAAGLRPAAGNQSEGVTAAQGAHLQDMRAITFHKLGMQP